MRKFFKNLIYNITVTACDFMTLIFFDDEINYALKILNFKKKLHQTRNSFTEMRVILRKTSFDKVIIFK